MTAWQRAGHEVKAVPRRPIIVAPPSVSARPKRNGTRLQPQEPTRPGTTLAQSHEYELYLAVEDIDHSRTKTKSPQTVPQNSVPRSVSMRDSGMSCSS